MTTNRIRINSGEPLRSSDYYVERLIRVGVFPDFARYIVRGWNGPKEGFRTHESRINFIEMRGRQQDKLREWGYNDLQIFIIESDEYYSTIENLGENAGQINLYIKKNLGISEDPPNGLGFRRENPNLQDMDFKLTQVRAYAGIPNPIETVRIAATLEDWRDNFIEWYQVRQNIVVTTEDFLNQVAERTTF